MSERVARNAGEYIKRHSELQITNCNLIPARSVGTRADGLFRRGRGRNLSLPTTISLTALRFRFRSGLLILRSRESEARSQRLHVSTHVSPDDGSFRIETGVRLAIRNKRDTGAVEGGGGARVARTGWKGPQGANVPRRKEGWARVVGASGAVYMAKGASPEPYRSLTLKFKETDNSFPFRRASVLQYHIPFLSFHCLVKPALIIKDCYPGSYA